MTQSMNIASVVALSIVAALAGTGCMAQQGTEEETSNEPEITAGQPDEDATTTATNEEKADQEKTGETKQACFGGFGGFGGCGFGGGCGGFLGCGIGLAGYGCLPGGYFGGFPPFFPFGGIGWGGGCGGCGGGCF